MGLKATHTLTHIHTHIHTHTRVAAVLWICLRYCVMTPRHEYAILQTVTDVYFGAGLNTELDRIHDFKTLPFAKEVRKSSYSKITRTLCKIYTVFKSKELGIVGRSHKCCLKGWLLNGKQVLVLYLLYFPVFNMVTYQFRYTLL